jgi:hypothetical protein
MDTGWRNSRISRSFSRSDKRPMLTIATSVEKRCSRTNQPKDINRGVVYPHICVKIPWDRVFIPYGLEKDDEELALIRRANRILNSAFETAQKTINPGVNELEVYDAIHHTILMDIQEPFILDVTFASGPNTVSRHGPPIGRHLVEGDLFINKSLFNTRDV